MANIGSAIVSFGADTSQLDKALRSTVGQIDSFAKQGGSLAKSFGIELSSALEKNVKKLQELESYLKSINAPASDLEKVSARLAIEQKKLADALGQSAEKSLTFSGAISAIKPIMAIAGGAMLEFGSIAVEAFMESEKVGAQLDAVLKSTGGSAGVTKEEIIGLSESLAKVTTFGHDAIAAGEALLLTFTNIGKDIFPEATQVMLDMSQALGQDLKSSAIQLGKALQDPINGMTALKRVGVTFDDAQKKLIETLLASGKVMEAQKVILQELEKEFGGSAKAAGETFAGKIAQARDATDEFYESIGGKLVPSLQSLMKDFPNASTAAIGFKDAIGQLNISSGELLTALPLMKMAFGSVLPGMGGMTSMAVALAPALGAAALSVGAFAVAYARIAEEEAVNEELRKTVGITQELIDKFKEAAAAKALLGLGDELELLKNQLSEYTAAQAKAEETSTKLSREQLNFLHQLAEQRATEIGNTKTVTEIYEGFIRQVKAGTFAANEFAGAHVNIKKAIDFTRPSLQQQIVDLERSIAAMKATVVADKDAEEQKQRVWAAEDKLAKLKQQALEISKKAQAEIDKENKLRIEMRNQIDKSREGLAAYIEQQTKWVDRLKLDMPEAISEIEKVTKAFNYFGEKSPVELQQAADEAATQFQIMSESGVASAAQIDAAWKKMVEARNAAGDDSVHVITSQYEVMEDAGKKVASVWDKQISTIVTDLSKGFTDAIFKAKDFGSAMINIFKEMGSAILRGVIEPLFGSIVKGFASLLSGKGFKLDTSSFAGIAGLFGSKSSGQLGGIDSQGSYTDLSSLFGGSSSTSWATRAGNAAAGFGTGYGLSSALGGGTITNAISGAAGGLGGAFAGSIAAALSLGTWAIPFIGPIIGAATAGIGAAITHFTRRGKEKVTATGALEEANKAIWDVVAQAKAGTISAADAITAVNQISTEYENFLRSNLKDQTVIRRSLDQFKATTLNASGGAIDQLNKLSETQTKATETRTKLLSVLDEFIKTSGASESLAKYLGEVGGKMSDFEEAAKIKPMQDFQGSLEKMIESLSTAPKTFDDVVSSFLETGEVTEELTNKFKEFGGDTEALVKYGDALKKLNEFRGTFGNMASELQKLIPQQASAIDQFNQLGIITPELAGDIYKFGLNMGDFRKVAMLTETNNDFQALIDNFSWTEQGISSLNPMFVQLGGNMDVLNAAAAIPGLNDLLGTINQLSSGLDAVLPKTKSMVEMFYETGQVTPDLAKAITDAGGDIGVFNDFGKIANVKKQWDPLFEAFQKAGDWMKLDSADQQQLTNLMRSLNDPNINLQIDTGQFDAAVNSAATTISGQYTQFGQDLKTEIGKMGTNVQTEIGKLKTALETEIGKLKTGLETELGTLRQGLVDAIGDKDGGLTKAVDDTKAGLVSTLQTLDTNLGTALTSLETRLGTAVDNLVKAASETNPPANTNTTPPTNQSTPGNYGNRPAGYPAYMPWPPNSYALGGYIDQPQLAMLHAGEYVLPKNVLERAMTLRMSYPSAASGSGGSIRGGAVVNQTINFNNATDPFAEKRLMERVNDNLTMRLAMGV